MIADHEVAAALADEASQRLVELQQRAIASRTTGWQLEYTGDEVAQGGLEEEGHDRKDTDTLTRRPCPTLTPTHRQREARAAISGRVPAAVAAAVASGSYSQLRQSAHKKMKK